MRNSVDERIAVSITIEQKLVFCLAQNTVHLERSIDAFKISRILVECGVFDGNPLPVGEQCNEATFVLLKYLFEMWSLKNGARVQQFRIFRLAVGEAGNREILEECLPDLGCSEEELDAHVLRLKDRNDDVAKWLTPDTGSAEELVDSPSIRDGRKTLKLGELTSLECSSILQKILSHRCCDIGTVWQLLASSSFLMDENRILTLGQTLELPIINVQEEVKMKKGNAAQRGMLAKGVNLRQSAECSFLQRTLACSRGEIGRIQGLLVSTTSMMEKKAEKGKLERLTSVKFEKCEGMLQSILCQHKYDSSKSGVLLASAKGESRIVRRRSPAVGTHKVAEHFFGKEECSVNATDHVLDSYEYLLYKFAFQEVHVYWKQMGVSLGFTKTRLDGIEDHHQAHRLGPKDMAWTVLHEYYKKELQREKTSVDYLRSVLRDVKLTVGSQMSFPFLTESDKSAAVIGRDKEIEKIQAFLWGLEVKNYLVAPMTERKIQVIAGLGGVGKTSLAKCYARKHANAYSDGVFQFNAESYGSLLTSIRQNLSAIQTAEEGTKGNALVSENARIFCMYLRHCPRSLIILDNADERELVRECIPDASIPCHVLITTRKENLFRKEKVPTLVLQKLEEDCAVGALLNWSGKQPDSFEKMNAEEREFAQKLAVDPPVEGLPLALAHAGVFIDQHNLTFRMYWRRLQAKKKELDAAALDMDTFLAYFRLSHLKEALQREGVLCPSDLLKAQISEVSGKSFEQSLMMKAVDSLKNRRHVHLTWEMDLDDIKDKHPNSYLVLQCSSVLSSQDIPQSILSNSAFPEEDGGELSEISLAISMRCLKERSFLQETERNDSSVVYSMHHLIQTSVLERSWGNASLYQNILQTVGQCLMQHLLPLIPAVESGNLTDPFLISLLPHLYSVAKRMLEFGMNSEQPGDIVDLACILSQRYRHLEVSRTLNSLRIKNLENTPDSLGISFNKQEQLTQCYLGFACEAFASQRHQEVERHVNLVFGDRSPDELSDEELAIPMYLQGLVLLARSYCRQQLFDKAQTLLSRMIAVYSHSSNPLAKTELWAACMGMASLHHRQGSYQKQLDMLHLALPLCSDLEGKDRHLALYYRSFGEALQGLNRNQEALAYFTKSFESYKAVLPENHIVLADVALSISKCLGSLGRYKEAVERSREALTTARSALPPRHVQVCEYLRCYAQDLVWVKKIPEAVFLLEECVSILRTAPSDVHLQTLRYKSLCFLGMCLQAMGKKRNATNVLDEGLKLAENPLVENDCNITCLSLVRLGKLHSDMNRKDVALPHFRRAFNVAKEFSLDDSSIRQDAVLKFFKCLIELRQFSEAEERILDFFDSPMSDDHFLTQQINVLYNELLDIRDYRS